MANSGLTQKELARLLKIDKGNFSKFFSGQQGLSVETTLQLVRLMSLSKRDLAFKFGQPDRTRSRLMYLQESGRTLQFDSVWGWTAGTGPDPADGDITTVNTNPARTVPDDDFQFLAGLAALHQAIIDRTNARQVQKAGPKRERPDTRPS